MAIKSYSLNDVEEKDLTPMKWAVPDLIPVGLTCVAAKQKTGKSYLMLGVAISIAKGTIALGKIPVQKKEVLYLSFEDGKRRVHQRATEMTDAFPDALQIAHEMQPLGYGGLDELEEYRLEHPELGMVIIDTIVSVEAHEKGADPRAEVYRELGPLQKWSLENDIATVFVTHLHRAKEDRDPQDAIYGSSGYAQISDAILLMDRPRNTNEAKLTVSGRDIPDKEYALHFDDTLGSWTIASDPGMLAILNLPQEQARLVAAIRETPDITPGQLAKKLGKSIGSVDQLLREAREKKTVVSNKGKYRIMEKEPVAAGVRSNGYDPEPIDMDAFDDYDPD